MLTIIILSILCLVFAFFSINYYLHLGTLFSNMDIDELVDSFRDQFDVVERIDGSEIDDWI